MGCSAGIDPDDKEVLDDKVLDMGCGTRRVSKYIADIIGPDGQVVAVDPGKVERYWLFN